MRVSRLTEQAFFYKQTRKKHPERPQKRWSELTEGTSDIIDQHLEGQKEKENISFVKHFIPQIC